MELDILIFIKGGREGEKGERGKIREGQKGWWDKEKQGLNGERERAGKWRDERRGGERMKARERKEGKREIGGEC